MAPVKKTHTACKTTKWYKADDVKTHFKRKTVKPTKTTLKKSIQPG